MAHQVFGTVRPMGVIVGGVHRHRHRHRAAAVPRTAGSMLQIIVASAISLGFLAMHARCWPFVDHGKNLLKLGSEVVLMLVFLAAAVMRSALRTHDMVDAKLLREEDLTEEERDMPELLSVFMVLVSVLIPCTIFLYSKFKKPDEKQEGESDDDTNPMFDDGQDAIENPIALETET